MIKLKDFVYGEFEINEPVLQELLNSLSLLRLKKISQFGVPDQYYHVKNYSRYEHSVGVMLLLRKLGADLEEQVAGLIHDVSHLAFSHVADWVFAQGKEGNEDLQDSLLKEFVEKSEIGEIFERHGLDAALLVNENNFPLLEKEIPDLCADRLDYSLREFKYWYKPKLVEACLADLAIVDSKIVFRHQDTAFDFASGFLGLQTQHWGEFEAVARYYLFSQVLKIAIEEKIISQKDFYLDDEFILNKIENADHPSIKTILEIMANKKLGKIPVGLKTRAVKKFRYVDPKVKVGYKLVRLSKLNSNFRKMLWGKKKKNLEGIALE